MNIHGWTSDQASSLGFFSPPLRHADFISAAPTAWLWGCHSTNLDAPSSSQKPFLAQHQHSLPYSIHSSTALWLCFSFLIIAAIITFYYPFASMVFFLNSFTIAIHTSAVSITLTPELTGRMALSTHLTVLTMKVRPGLEQVQLQLRGLEYYLPTQRSRGMGPRSPAYKQ